MAASLRFTQLSSVACCPFLFQLRHAKRHAQSKQEDESQKKQETAVPKDEEDGKVLKSIAIYRIVKLLAVVFAVA